MMKSIINTTLCYIECDGKYLMLHRTKKKNDINEGKWIGIGGKFEEGETAEDCMLREVYEETGINLSSYTYNGVVHFRSDKDDEEMYLFSAKLEKYPDLPECNEGELIWVDKDKVLDLNLWEGDKYFLKKLIQGETDMEMLLRYIGEDLVEYKEKK